MSGRINWSLDDFLHALDEGTVDIGTMLAELAERAPITRAAHERAIAEMQKQRDEARKECGRAADAMVAADRERAAAIHKHEREREAWNKERAALIRERDAFRHRAEQTGDAEIGIAAVCLGCGTMASKCPGAFLVRTAESSPDGVVGSGRCLGCLREQVKRELTR